MTLKKNIYFMFLGIILLSSFSLPYLNEASAQILPLPPLPEPIPLPIPEPIPLPLPTNSPPTAINDSATTNENTPVRIDVLRNDSDPDGDALSVTSTSTPSNGAAVINSDNTITYSPNSGFSGTDSFTYRISDGNGGSDAATVTVTVFASTPQPTATLTVQSADMSDTTFEGMWVELFQNDQLIDSGFTPFSTTVDSGAQYVVDVANFQDIVFDHWEDGSTNPARAFSISEDSTFTAFYQTGTAPPPPQNSPPIANDDSDQTQVNTSVIIDVLGNDSDPDEDTLSVTSTSAPSDGAASINADNTITYTPNQNFVGTDSFTYTISDGNGGTDTATVTVTVSDTSQPNNPPTAVNDTMTTNEDTSVTIDVLANDSDPDDGDTIFLDSFDPTAQNPASKVMRDDNGTPLDQSDDKLVYTPAENSFGSEAFSYTISDGNGGTDTATVTVTVISVNDPPVANDDSEQTQVNTSVTIDVLANDIDVENNPLSVTSTSAPSDGAASINADNTITYTPNQNFVGTDSFTYTISDGNGGTDTATVTVTVSDPTANNPPVANDDSEQTQVNTSVTIDVLANDTDPDDGDTISLTSFDADSKFNGTITRDTNGTPQQSDDKLVYTPPANMFGNDTFTYTISDGRGGTDTATVSVTVPPS